MEVGSFITGRTTAEHRQLDKENLYQQNRGAIQPELVALRVTIGASRESVNYVGNGGAVQSRSGGLVWQ